MIKAVLMMTTLGAGLGLLLAIAGKVLYVEVDNRVETIIGMLPGLNCSKYELTCTELLKTQPNDSITVFGVAPVTMSGNPE